MSMFRVPEQTKFKKQTNKKYPPFKKGKKSLGIKLLCRIDDLMGPAVILSWLKWLRTWLVTTICRVYRERCEKLMWRKHLSDVRDQRSGCKGQTTTGYRKDLCIASVNEQCLKPCVRLHHEAQTDVRQSDVHEDNISQHEVHAVHWQNTQSSVLWATRVVLQICHFKCPLCNNQKPLAIAIAIKQE